MEEKAKAQNINIRDSLFGGRTEGFKIYVSCVDNQQIFYYDVSSLYPIVNAFDHYATGFKRYVKITVDDIRNGSFLKLM